MPRTDCPTPSELSAFALGDLPDGALDDVADHLERCPHCEAAARVLDPVADDLIRTIRDWGGRGGAVALRPTAALPRRVGEYELVAELGRGGMGAVYRAVHTRLDKVVALKLLAAWRLDDPEAVGRFRREMLAAGRLDHPHIVAATDAGEADGTPYLAMEYVAGADLADLVRRSGPVGVADACELVRQAALGLGHAHAHGLVHRDVKPSNLLLSRSGTVKLLDLGVARLPAAVYADGATATGLVVGSFDYMAPEQADDPRAVDARADLYGLGCTLYFLLTGGPPFPAPAYQSPLQKLKAHATVPAPDLCAARPDVPAGLDAIFHRLLAKAPADRFATADALARALATFTTGSDTRALAIRTCPDDTALEPRAAADTDASLAATRANGRVPVRRRRRFAAASGLAAAVVVIVVAIAYSLRAGTEPPSPVAALVGPPRPLPDPDALARRASPADSLDRRSIPAELLAAAGRGDAVKAPPQLVAVLKDNRLAHPCEVIDVNFSPDGGRIACASGHFTNPAVPGEVRVWDATTGEPRLRITGHTARVVAAAYSHDGKHLASAGADRAVRVWNAETGELTLTVAGLTDAATWVAFNPDGTRLAVCQADGAVAVWDAVTGLKALDLPRQPGFVGHVAFSPDGTTLATAGHDNTARVWDLKTGHELWCLRGHTQAVSRLAFRHDGTRLATAGYDRQAKVWDLKTGECVLTLPQTAAVFGVAYRPDGRQLATAAGDGLVRQWDADTGRPERSQLGHAGGTLAVTYDPTGRRLATAGLDKRARIWDAATGRNLLPEAGHTAPVLTAAFSPDGRLLATGGQDTTARLWDVSAAREARVLAGHSGTVRAVAFGPDGATLATGGQDGTVRLWDTTRGTETRKLTVLEWDRPWVRAVAFAPDGRELATASQDGLVKLWDPATGELRRALTGHTDAACAVAYSVNGRLLISGSDDGAVRLWDPATGTAVTTLTGHTDHVYALAVLPDGCTLASAGRDRTVRLWDLTTGRERAVLEGHPGIVSGLAAHPAGRSLASVSEQDGTLRLWDLTAVQPTAAVTHLYPAEQSRVFAGCAFSPEGRYLATANPDGTAYLLRLAPRPRD